MIIIFFYLAVILLLFIILCFTMKWNKQSEKNNIHSEILLYLSGDPQNIENTLKNFFSQSIWYDMTEIETVYMINIDENEETEKICKKYEEKYPIARIWKI